MGDYIAPDSLDEKVIELRVHASNSESFTATLDTSLSFATVEYVNSYVG